jgi:hypothetical protein
MDHSAIAGLLRETVEEHHDEAEYQPIEALLPFLKTYGMVNRTCTINDITHTDLKELCIRWGVRIKDPKTRKDLGFNELMHALLDHQAHTSSNIPGQAKKTVLFETAPGAFNTKETKVSAAQSIWQGRNTSGISIRVY